MPWVYLLIAAACEIAWAVGFKYSNGFTKLTPSIITIAFMIISFGFLSLAVRHLPMGTAYAVWTGIGAAGVAFYGMMFMGEPRDVMRLVAIGVIVAGIVLLKFSSPT